MFSLSALVRPELIIRLSLIRPSSARFIGCETVDAPFVQARAVCVL